MRKLTEAAVTRSPRYKEIEDADTFCTGVGNEFLLLPVTHSHSQLNSACRLNFNMYLRLLVSRLNFFFVLYSCCTRKICTTKNTQLILGGGGQAFGEGFGGQQIRRWSDVAKRPGQGGDVHTCIHVVGRLT